MGNSLKTAQFLMDSRIADAMDGDAGACFDLGVAYSTGTQDCAIDMIEAHKWFNLAAMRGDMAAQQCRADVAEDMTAREVAEAQRQARAILHMNERRAA